MIYPSFEEFMRRAGEGNLIPVYREIIADRETPVRVLERLGGSPYVFLLESVEGGEKWGRYSFIGFEPRALIWVRPTETIVEENGCRRRVPHAGDALAVLREKIEGRRPVAVPGLPRFFGGAVGYFAYDMVRLMEARLWHRGFHDNDDNLAVFMITDTVIIFDHMRHTMKVVACAFLDGKDAPEAVYGESLERIDRVIELMTGNPPATKAAAGRGVPRFVPSMTDKAFMEGVMRAKEYIAAGDVIQVVLSRRLTAEMEIPPLDIYRALRFVNPSPYLFFLRFEDQHLIGSSPEVMVRLEGTTAELRPIAGTRPRGTTEQEDRRRADELLEDPKERAEHVMLVDLGRNDLGRVAKIGSVQVTSFMTVERYSHVMHLVSNIRAELAEGKDAFDLFQAAFPAGTLTGAPKVRAMEIIDELETGERGFYGGAVGYFAYGGAMDFCITIRTFLSEGCVLSLQVGAGIVADSDPVAELQETQNKAAGLIKAVMMAADGLVIREN